MLGRRRLRWGIAATAIALAAGGAPPAVADGDAADGVVTAVTFNMAGWQHWRGNPLAGDLVAGRIAASDSNPVIVGLNEVCGSEDGTGDTQLVRIGGRLGDAWTMVFAPTRRDPAGGLVPEVRDPAYGGNCPAVGNALLVRDTPQDFTETVHPLTKPSESNSKHDRNLVCGSAPVAVCVTHLDPLHATDQAGQAFGLVEKHKVRLVLGDFNLRPDAEALEDWYGAFDEGDELQRPTHLEGKIDYVFADKAMFEPVGAAVTPFFSDHLWYEATFSVEP